jgi:hypothetical protein
VTDASTTGEVKRLIERLMLNTPVITQDHMDAATDIMPQASRMIRALVAERDAEIQRAEAAERELHTLTTAGIIEVAIRNPSVMDYMKHWESRAERAEAEITQFCAQAALAWKAGRDAAAAVTAQTLRQDMPDAENVLPPDRFDEGTSAAYENIAALTPPAYLSAALTARLDAEWNAAIEAAGNLESVHGYSNAVPRHRIRALRRAAPMEGEA